MSRSSKGVMKIFGDKFGGGSGGKDSSSSRGKSTAAPPPKKKTQEVSPDAQAMEVDALVSSISTRGPGKGKSFKVLKDSLSSVDKVKKIVEGGDLSEDDDAEVVTDSFDVKTCHEDILFRFIP